MKILRKVSNGSIKFLEGFSIILLIAMIVLTFTQVVLRYIFNAPLSWAAEVSIIFLIWFGYLGIAIAKQEDTHIAISFLYDKFSKKIQIILNVIRELFSMVFAVLMIKHGIILYLATLAQRLPATGISKSIMYAALIVAGLLILFYSLVELIENFKKIRESV